MVRDRKTTHPLRFVLEGAVRMDCREFAAPANLRRLRHLLFCPGFAGIRPATPKASRRM